MCIKQVPSWDFDIVTHSGLFVPGRINTFSRMAGNIYGVAELSASPYYSLTLDTGTPEEPYVLPLTLIDSAKYICKWIIVVGKRIRIHQLLIVCEQYVTFVWSLYFIVCTLRVKCIFY